MYAHYTTHLHLVGHALLLTARMHWSRQNYWLNPWSQSHCYYLLAIQRCLSASRRGPPIAADPKWSTRSTPRSKLGSARVRNGQEVEITTAGRSPGWLRRPGKHDHETPACWPCWPCWHAGYADVFTVINKRSKIRTIVASCAHIQLMALQGSGHIVCCPSAYITPEHVVTLGTTFMDAAFLWLFVWTSTWDSIIVRARGWRLSVKARNFCRKRKCSKEKSVNANMMFPGRLFVFLRRCVMHTQRRVQEQGTRALNVFALAINTRTWSPRLL